MTGRGRDRLRELLDAVLADEHEELGAMATSAFATPWHFSRQLRRSAGEPPVALRRRVILERAAWQLRQGTSVTDAAFGAGYESVEGFSRAFARSYGYPPSSVAGPGASGSAGLDRARAPESSHAHWLPAPNGIHFHPPMHLWVSEHDEVPPNMQLVAQLVQHDVDDTTALVRRAAELTEPDYRKVRLPGFHVLEWDGPEESIAAVLEHQVWAKEVWLAAIEGRDFPSRGHDDPRSLLARQEHIGPRWADTVREIDRQGSWGDRLIDALCEPPESFVLAHVVTHVITFAAHRRQLARQLLRQAGLTVDHGDPIDWLRENRTTTATEQENNR
ncbi:MAG TPA: helix-turn-helix domain-containing protein [Candidatus Ruania gallistercoris]|uniref:Helix-turn-helix domain-containing protein n=1 Tax=Candidatus Ruania gallistercoris TaxID=2838746 RepID=A0A9D2J2N6_9MICO|nr:helix-turn-helix domain-containing protein [Candidatus Ruania gallistercoris]